jgi:hypothetical protein
MRREKIAANRPAAKGIATIILQRRVRTVSSSLSPISVSEVLAVSAELPLLAAVRVPATPVSPETVLMELDPGPGVEVSGGVATGGATRRAGGRAPRMAGAAIDVDDGLPSQSVMTSVGLTVPGPLPGMRVMVVVDGGIWLTPFNKQPVRLAAGLVSRT